VEMAFAARQPLEVRQGFLAVFPCEDGQGVGDPHRSNWLAFAG